MTGRVLLATLTGLIAANLYAAINDRRSLDALANRPTLTWRQQAILNERGKVHACQHRLGFPRSPVAQTIITGGPAYRAWVLNRWRQRARFCAAAELRLSEPRAAIMAVFGPRYGPAAVRVASCETGGTFNVWASNGQYQGLFQVSSHWRHAIPGFAYTPLAQARHAYRVFRATGYSWAHWACQP